MITGKHIRLFFAILFLSLGFHTSLTAQIHGTVKDEIEGKSLVGAYVVGLQDTKQVAYSFTREDGSFELPEDKTITQINVSMMGFETQRIRIQSAKPIIIILKQANYHLKASSVKQKVIQEHGDTTVFYAQNFRDGMEKNAADVLKKLPGVTVTPSGGIIHSGQYINKFYVEGMDLMGSRYGVVTNNLNPDDIASIEIYRNHQPVKILKDITVSSRSAINIILKQSVKNTWLISGDALFGAPVFPSFHTRGMLSRFGKQAQNLFLLKGNNLGKDVDTEIREQSYFGKTGAFLITSDSDSDFSTVLSPINNPLNLPQMYWYDNLTGLLSINHLTKTGKDGQLKFQFHAAAEKYKEEGFSVEMVHLPGQDIIQIEEGKQITDTKYYFSALADYAKNTASLFLENEFSISGQLRNQIGLLSQNTSTPYQGYKLPSLKIYNNLRISIPLNNQKVLSFSSNNQVISNQHGALYRVNENEFTQNYKLRSFNSKNNITHSISLENHKINLNANLDFKYTDINTTFHVAAFGSGITLTDRFYAGRVQFTTSLPVSIHLLLSSVGKYFYPELTPRLNILYPISNFWDLSANAQWELSRSKEVSLFPDPVIRTYRTTVSADSLAQNNKINTSVTVRFSDTPNLFYSSLSLHHMQSRRNRQTANRYNGQFQHLYYLNQPTSQSSSGINASIKKYFGIKTFVIEGLASFIHSSSRELLQEKELFWFSNNINTTLSASFHPVNWLTVSGKGVFTKEWTRGSFEGNFHSIDIDCELRLQPVKQLKIDSQFYFRRDYIDNVVIADNKPFINLEISWKFPAFILTAECRNILGVNEYRREYIKAYRSYSSTNKLRGRCFLLGIQMQL